MKKFLYISFFMLMAVHLGAQQVAVEKDKPNIIEDLTTQKTGQGQVTIYQEESLKDVVGHKIVSPKRAPVYSDGNMQYVKIHGFKVQAFAGNHQRESKNEAYQKQGMIQNAFPQYESVVIFDSPFWRVRVGNFQTREEANEAMQTMRRKFPSFGKEMYIVRDEVKIPLHQYQEVNE
ncbi:MAG: SPOR domain-containing protein [Dysgonamonadaceae bacterium]|nr:SPOR domain-containing protein [Dysgonamonadaceae bacterium]MDD3309216.1 SPOR domain-containing protein [Dysgonamonadaceae bacterium]MDD3900743.1 SPOR domain-containing protein [Dysgonamonadaceae bacterium]MDD4398361.1 SPOR domain-containing protein [Dysgonamonadaceae bacterium]MEA5080765.1 SPOR domain-containing protein [Dysgonamonadaceae bacterium]